MNPLDYCSRCRGLRATYVNGRQIRCKTCGSFLGRVESADAPTRTFRGDQSPRPGGRRLAEAA